MLAFVDAAHRETKRLASRGILVNSFHEPYSPQNEDQLDPFDLTLLVGIAMQMRDRGLTPQDVGGKYMVSLSI
jgi:hypothetical protein